MTTADAVVQALRARGIDAYVNVGLEPTEVEISVEAGTIHLARDENRSGWEATLDSAGEYRSLADGPASAASAECVADWITREVRA